MEPGDAGEIPGSGVSASRVGTTDGRRDVPLPGREYAASAEREHLTDFERLTADRLVTGTALALRRDVESIAGRGHFAEEKTVVSGLSL